VARGFSLVAESDQPIYQNSTRMKAELIENSANDQKSFIDITAIALRVKPGDDASCLNLYRPWQPRLLTSATMTTAVLPAECLEGKT
jgi:hypothetical protein